MVNTVQSSAWSKSNGVLQHKPQPFIHPCSLKLFAMWSIADSKTAGALKVIHAFISYWGEARADLNTKPTTVLLLLNGTNRDRKCLLNVPRSLTTELLYHLCNLL